MKFCSRKYSVLLGLILGIILCACSVSKTGYYGFYAKNEAGESHNIESACINTKELSNSFLTLE